MSDPVAATVEIAIPVEPGVAVALADARTRAAMAACSAACCGRSRDRANSRWP